MRHTLDPVVPFNHRLLILYAVLGAARVFARVVLTLCGFSRLLAPCGRFRYWRRQALTSENEPMIFFHGISTGLPLYLLALWRVCRGRVSRSTGRHGTVRRGKGAGYLGKIVRLCFVVSVDDDYADGDVPRSSPCPVTLSGQCRYQGSHYTRDDSSRPRNSVCNNCCNNDCKQHQ